MKFKVFKPKTVLKISLLASLIYSPLSSYSEETTGTTSDFMSVIKKRKESEEKKPEEKKPDEKKPVEKKSEVKNEQVKVDKKLEEVPTEKDQKKVEEKSILAELAPVTSVPQVAPKKKKHKKKLPTTVRDNEPTSPSEQPKIIETKDLLTSNWSGLRSKLAEKGIEIEAIYKGEVSSNLSGGVRKGTVYLGNFDFKTSINAETLLGWKGVTAFVYLLVDHGKDPTTNVGDAQGTSNIETPVNTFKLYEAWLQQSFIDEKASILVGLHDLNSEFYVTETSGLFLNSSFGVGKELAQTGKNGPSIFPTTSLALRMRAEPSKSFYIQTGLFNGVSGDPENPRGTHVKFGGSNGLLVISEMAFLRGKEEKSENKYSKYGVGLWNYTKTVDHQVKTVDGTTTPVQVNNNGFYLLAEQTIFEPLAIFARYGVANSEANRFHSNFSYGLVATGLIPSRNSDRLGIAVTKVANGQEYEDLNRDSGTFVKHDETTYEISYKFELKKGLAIQPDFQYVMNPNTDPTLKDAKVAAVRFEIAL